MEGFYIGTYNSATSEGIYYATMDMETGELTTPVLAANTSNPSYLAISSRGDYIYAVNENVQGQDHGQVTSFKVDSAGVLSEIASVSSQGAYPCYISLPSTSDVALVANYGGGSVLSVNLEENGGLGSAVLSQHRGQGTNPERQEGPHAHYVREIPMGEHALVADLGLDKIFMYKIGEGGALILHDSISVAPGSGPRHIDFHPNGKVIYVINELNSTITVFSYNKFQGTMTELQTVSTLPEGYDGSNSCADIHVNTKGTILFGSNRGHDSIVSYLIQEDGTLELAGHYSENVDWPRNFVISPNGEFLLIGSERGNSISTARIDANSGTLTPTGSSVTVGKPVCLVFSP